MNPELPSNPREELELRVTALLLGELSEAEAASVRAAIAQDAELQKLHDDLKQTIYLIHEATTVASESSPEQSEPLKLSEERRKSLHAAFVIPPLKPEHIKVKRERQWFVPAAAIATILAVLGLWVFFGSRRERGAVVVALNERRESLATEQPQRVRSLGDARGNIDDVAALRRPEAVTMSGRAAKGPAQNNQTFGAVESLSDSKTATGAPAAENEARPESDVNLRTWAMSASTRGFYDDNYTSSKPASAAPAQNSGALGYQTLESLSAEPKPTPPPAEIVLPKSGDSDGDALEIAGTSGVAAGDDFFNGGGRGGGRGGGGAGTADASGSLQSRDIPVKYASPANVQQALQDTFADGRSQAVVDFDGGKKLTIIGSDKDGEAAEELVRKLDTPSKQVLLETKVTESKFTDRLRTIISKAASPTGGEFATGSNSTLDQDRKDTWFAGASGKLGNAGGVPSKPTGILDRNVFNLKAPPDPASLAPAPTTAPAFGGQAHGDHVAGIVADDDAAAPKSNLPQKALSSTTISGYADTSVEWKLKTVEGSQPNADSAGFGLNPNVVAADGAVKQPSDRADVALKESAGEKVPVLKDLPVVGHPFQSASAAPPPPASPARQPAPASNKSGNGTLVVSSGTIVNEGRLSVGEKQLPDVKLAGITTSPTDSKSLVRVQRESNIVLPATDAPANTPQFTVYAYGAAISESAQSKQEAEDLFAKKADASKPQLTEQQLSNVGQVTRKLEVRKPAPPSASDSLLTAGLRNQISVGAQGGTAPSYTGVPSAANPSGVFPGTPPTFQNSDKVPVLGDQPTMGHLFRSQATVAPAPEQVMIDGKKYVREFVGYDDPGQFAPQAQSVGNGVSAGLPITALSPVPHYRLKPVDAPPAATSPVGQSELGLNKFGTGTLALSDANYLNGGTVVSGGSLSTLGNQPADTAAPLTPAWTKDRVQNETKIQNARLLFESGKYDEAEVLLKDSLKSDPNNYAAAYYSSLVKEQRDAKATLSRTIQAKDRILQVEKAWDSSAGREKLPAPQMVTNGLVAGSNRDAGAGNVHSLNIVGYVNHDFAGAEIPITTNAVVSDPEWAGVLEQPSLPHSSSNRFVTRNTYMPPSAQAYTEKQRELENLVAFQKILEQRLAMEKVDVTLPRTGMVTIMDRAVPPAAADAGVLGRIGQALKGDYEATASIKLDRPSTDISEFSSRNMSGVYDPYFIQTEFEAIKSETVLTNVIARLDLNKKWATKKGSDQPLKTSDTLNLLRSRLELKPVRNTMSIQIQGKSSDPAEAATIANAVAEAYQQHRLAEIKRASEGGVRALEERFVEQQAKVKKAAQDLAALREGTKPGAPATVIDAPLPRKPATNAPVAQPEIQTSENNFSTFSLNVSDVSFKLAAASLEKGQMPDSASIRSEEFINAFDYRDPEPTVPLLGGDRGGSSPIAFAWERARYPFAHNRDLLRFSLKTAAAGRQAGRPLNIVLLLDNSGSMERADRVGIIREALRVLAKQLQPQDKLSVITFARTPRLVADGITGDKAGEVAERVSGLTPEGGTNLEDAMNLAYQTAAKHFQANGINRVVVLTDGAANLGDVEPESLKQKVEAQRKQGIALDCFGIGWDGFNDDLLEVLSRNGDGRYGFINSPEEAASEFAGQLAGALKVAASDVKVQVEFNPKRVSSYRQIGYAKHQLKKEQFRDNTVDAAEIAAQEAGNALYTVEVNPAGEGPLATVRVRFKVPGTTDYREQAWDVPFNGNAVALEQSSAAMRLATSASAFSEWLAVSPHAGEVTPDALLNTLSGVPEAFGADSRPKKLEWMIRQAKSLEGK